MCSNNLSNSNQINFGIVGIPAKSMSNPKIFSLIKKGQESKTVIMAKNEKGEYIFYFTDYIENSKREKEFIKYLSKLTKSVFSASKETAKEDKDRFIKEDLSEIVIAKKVSDSIPLFGINHTTK